MAVAAQPELLFNAVPSLRRNISVVKTWMLHCSEVKFYLPVRAAAQVELSPVALASPEALCVVLQNAAYRGDRLRWERGHD